MKTPTTILQYIAKEKPPVRKTLTRVRALIAKNAPKALEKIAWGMPTFHQDGNLIHFAAFANHMSLFPGPDAIVRFKKELADYPTSKGTIQVPYDRIIPATLVAQIVKFCVRRNRTAAAVRKAKRVKRKKRGRD